ncbi:hypothetical protein M422DRAFT_203822 [Sphaerobolus stellatus SS14]|nr:hypothetical protein M422DRAFT_203822 [Sphaerobolus stellatus SS14]
MNLTTLLEGSSISRELQEALASCGINTAQDLIFAQTQHILSRLPAGVATPQDITNAKNLVSELSAAPGIRGDELFRRDAEGERTREACLSGVKELDSLLGGFGKYETIEIAGGNKSSKTGLVMNVVLRDLANYPDHRALWLDVGGEFAIERAANILELHSGPGSATAFDRLSIVTCFNIAEAHEALNDLRVSLSSKEEGEPHLRFLVFDTLTPLLAPLLSATSSQGHAVMVTFMRMIGSLARNYSFTCLVTNTASQSLPRNPYSAFPTTTSKPALGPTFMFMTDDTLWLSDAMHIVDQGKLEAGCRVFVAEVLRSHSTFSQTWCAFVLRKGISLEPFPVSNLRLENK